MDLITGGGKETNKYGENDFFLLFNQKKGGKVVFFKRGPIRGLIIYCFGRGHTNIHTYKQTDI